MLYRTGIAAAAGDPDWVQKTLRDMQRQIDQLRALIGGSIGASAVLTTSTLTGTTTSSTVTVSNFAGQTVPGQIAVRTFV